MLKSLNTLLVRRFTHSSCRRHCSYTLPNDSLNCSRGLHIDAAGLRWLGAARSSRSFSYSSEKTGDNILHGREDRYSGVIVESDQLPQDPSLFSTKLNESLKVRGSSFVLGCLLGFRGVQPAELFQSLEQSDRSSGL